MFILLHHAESVNVIEDLTERKINCYNADVVDESIVRKVFEKVSNRLRVVFT